MVWLLSSAAFTQPEYHPQEPRPEITSLVEKLMEHPDEYYPAEAASGARYLGRVRLGDTILEALYVDWDNDKKVDSDDHFHLWVKKIGETTISFSDVGLDAFPGHLPHPPFEYIDGLWPHRLDEHYGSAAEWTQAEALYLGFLLQIGSELEKRTNEK